MLESDFYRRQILTSKVGPHAESVNVNQSEKQKNRQAVNGNQT